MGGRECWWGNSTREDAETVCVGGFREGRSQCAMFVCTVEENERN